MSAVLSPSPPASPPPPASPSPAARFRTAAEWLASLGNVPADRILMDPLPGTATVDDVIRLTDRENRGVELIEGTLVEKTVGIKESVIASRIIRRLGNVVEPNNLGYVSGEQGTIRMLMGNVRIPDVAYFRRADLPDGKLPNEAAPRIAPALVIEVLSPHNTAEEMRLKRIEYFANGVRAVWELDPPTRTLRAYDAPEQSRLLSADDTVDGGDVVPGFSARVGDLFDVD